MTSSFPSKPFPNEYQAIPEQTYFFQNSRLEADHPPVDDISNQVATTGWVKAELCGIALIPIVTKVNLLLISVSEGSVTRPKTTQTCHVKSTVTPIGVNKNSIEKVYIRYSDCSVVVTTFDIPENEAYLLALVTTDDIEIISIEPTSSPLGWAKLDSPEFTGDPKVPTPLLTDEDTSIANTYWVKENIKILEEKLSTDLSNFEESLLDKFSTLENKINSNFENLTNNLNNQINNLTLELKDKVNSLEEAIKILSAVFTNSSKVSLSELPRVEQINNLKIRVTKGKVSLLKGMTCNSGLSSCKDNICYTEETDLFILANLDGVINPKKQIWVRYSDCSIVASQEIPNENQGFRLAEITTDSSNITSIKNVSLDFASFLESYTSTYGGSISKK